MLGVKGPRTLRGRLLSLLMLSVATVILSVVLMHVSHGRFTQFTASTLFRKLPVITRAYQFEEVGHNLVLLSYKLLSAQTEAEIKTYADEISDILFELESITTELSAEGQFESVLDLNRLSQSLDHEIKVVVAYETRFRGGNANEPGNTERPRFLSATRERFERDIAEVASLSQSYRSQIEEELKRNVNEFNDIQARIRLMNMLAPVPLVGIMVLLGWALISGFSRRTELVNDVLLGKKTQLDDTFFSHNDELSQLGRVAIHFSRQQTLLKKARLDQENLVADLSNLIDRANSAIFAFDANGRISIWNQCVAELTGRSNQHGDAAIHIQDIICPNDHDAFLGYVQQARKGHMVSNVEICLIHSDGHGIPILFNLTNHLKSSAKEDEIVCIAQDLTLRNALQAEAVQASKLATLGEMSTGLAHEMNQPLNAMRITLSNLKRSLKKQTLDLSAIATQVERVDQQISRASEIINHMRVFGRRADEPPSVIDLKKCIESACQMVDQQLRLAAIDLNVDIQSDLKIVAHSVLFEQVILNLVANAKFELERRKVGGPWIAIRAYSQDNRVIVEVEDNGGGIPEKVLKRIFEPFFSTKEAGEGTGLGLSISYGIVEDAGGLLTVDNTEQGAKFTLKFPPAPATLLT